ncbi:Malic acid transport protein [Pseudocercospora fuligena]|uniref:Malic acid transport protein n=1 Tax=Pseudocercospora fuligena TaxID=685502 RepID=A0A8H6VKU4_9PEZI|nr:Malic acid transport protein [Pseudocercospora fuligena]
MMGRHEQNGLFWRKWQSSANPEKPSIENGSDASSEKVSLRRRLKHFTWAWFTLPMSTGGIALLLKSTPHRFTGLDTIGKVVYIFDLVVIISLCAAISARFIMNPDTLKKSLVHPTEALFFSTFFLALVNVLGGAQEYGGPSVGGWLEEAMRVLFWIYAALTFIVAVVQYTYLFTAPPNRLTIQSMTPGWILPTFPVMLCGTLATIFAPHQPTQHRMPMLVAGVTFQGLGWMVSFMVYAIYMHRLMQFGLPAPDLRPALPADAQYFAARPGMIVILQTMADFIAIFLWCLSFWFFCMTFIVILAGMRQMSFHLVWWAFVFPNVGFTLNTIRIGTQLKSQGILWVASIMTILLVAMWLFVLVCHVKAVVKKQIMMPGLDEDKDAYKDDDRKHNIPVPPDHFESTRVRDGSR